MSYERKPSRRRKYTLLGDRIIKVGGGKQMPIAKALGVSQQTVSKKLRGETAILVSDLEKLATAFGVGMDHWFHPFDFDDSDPDLARAIEKFRVNASAYRDAAVMLATLLPHQAEQARKMMGVLAGA